MTITKVLSTKMMDNELNVNDILRTDLMPTFFMANDEDNINYKNVSDLASEVTANVNGSIDAALSTLDYHR